MSQKTRVGGVEWSFSIACAAPLVLMMSHQADLPEEIKHALDWVVGPIGVVAGVAMIVTSFFRRRQP